MRELKVSPTYADIMPRDPKGPHDKGGWNWSVDFEDLCLCQSGKADTFAEALGHIVGAVANAQLDDAVSPPT